MKYLYAYVNEIGSDFLLKTFLFIKTYIWDHIFGDMYAIPTDAQATVRDCWGPVYFYFHASCPWVHPQKVHQH